MKKIRRYRGLARVGALSLILGSFAGGGCSSSSRTYPVADGGIGTGGSSASSGGAGPATGGSPTSGGHTGTGGGVGSGGSTRPVDASMGGTGGGDGGPPPPPTWCTPVSGTKITARKLADAVNGVAVLVTSPPGDDRLFVIEHDGGIRIFQNEALVPTPFLDIRSGTGGPVVSGGELGLLGLAFHPQYATNGQFFVFYTAANPTPGGDAYLDVLARYQVSAADPNVASVASGTTVLSIPDFAVNHNGGMIEFGSDGFLYLGTGDGGGGGDPNRNGQNPNALLGKFLRLDVDHKAGGKEYGIPPSNPFADGRLGAPEVFMLGVRDPWRWSFDRATGDLWIGDVGQSVTEELDVLKAGNQVGKNLGWSIYEGSACCATQADQCAQTAPQQPCSPTGLLMPQDRRLHSAGWNAIIGGQVYRGRCYPDIVGTYYYTDNGRGGLSTAKLQANGSVVVADLAGTFPTSPSSIHADAHGELYETDTTGNVYHLEAGP
jgi:glucose/arabinose dehydrogenase